jgi:hypothetical protein
MVRLKPDATEVSSMVRLKPDATEALKPDATGDASSIRSASARKSLSARDSSSLRAGASPSQNGMFGGDPFASATRTAPPATCSTRHEAFPSWKMSPVMLSMAKSSFTVPMNVSSGSRTTR